MTAHLVSHENVVHTTEEHSGKVHTNSGHPIVGTLQEAVGDLAATEAGDTAAIAGLAGLIGTLGATEGTDAAAFAGLAGSIGMLAAIEAADTAAFAAAVATLGTLAATEGPDVFAAAGTVVSAGAIAGSLNAVEGADVAAFVGAVETDAVVGVVVGGYYQPERPPLVEGIGDALLPRLVGKAHGVVVAASAGAGTLRSLSAMANGSTGAAGRAAAQLVLRAAAVGARGQAGSAAAVFDGLAASGSGAVIAQGQGSGVIANLEAAAIGRCDDDEAVVAWLLAA
jgi:hypothetical protein